jgi:phage terminase large subunit-like protein
VDGRADFLANRYISGPYPALLNLQCEQKEGRTILTGGEPTWEGLNLHRCQEIVDTIGLSAFMSEHQHEQHQVEGALWNREILDGTRVQDAPELVRIIVAVDPPGSSTFQSAEAGIVVAGKGKDEHAYVLADWSSRASPDEWGRRTVGAYHQYEADRIIGEVNNGGEMVEHTVRTIDRRIPYTAVRAQRGQSKTIRAEPVAAMYEQGICHHLGHFPKLEDQLCTWRQGEKSPDRLDALVWAMTHLMLDRVGKIRVTSIQ